MKIYRGVRIDQDKVIINVENGPRIYPLKHVVHHSPTGMEWGYGGSGPADTALSILADHFKESPTPQQLHRGNAQCYRYHMDFKFAFVSRFGQRWQITEDQIEEWLRQQSEKESSSGKQ